MHVTKRDGTTEPVLFDKITARLKKLATKLPNVDIARVTSLVAGSVADKISTAAIDDLAADACVTLYSEHPEYGTLAARIVVSNLHKQTSDDVLETYKKLDTILDPSFLEVVQKHKEELQSIVDYKRDYDFDFFGVRTMMHIYCAKTDAGEIIERPQHVYLRVAIALHGEDMRKVRESYGLMSKHKFTHASPTLFNAGLKVQQLASCFLGQVSDSLEDITDSWKEMAHISKLGGGLGMHVHHVRSKGAPITSTNGHSDGIIPMLRVMNSVVSYVNQSGRRKGSMAVYLSPHHPDVFEFLDLRRPGGEENMRCRDLFLAMWIPDLFMKRVEADAEWSLFDPFLTPGLDDVCGSDYEALYTQYEAEGKARKVIKARELWNALIRSQIESGTPYMLYSDACNSKSNQQNLGTIKCSNLCSEIVEYTSSGETAVCNLASISLPAFVKENGTFDFADLAKVTKVAAKNLDKVIDLNVYPVEKARCSNLKHRPIGIGVQGLADVFAMLRFPFDSEEAHALNKKIFATMYHAALEASAELAAEHGVYESYHGSPASEGKLQYDLWGVDPHPDLDWTGLKNKIRKHGLRNSLSIAVMPTASTAQVFSNNESVEPFTSVLYTRRTLAGEFLVVNRHLVNELLREGLWSTAMKDEIIRENGSIQRIAGIPQDIKKLYKTAWDLSQRTLIDQAAERGPYVCQSQSLNLFVAEPTQAKLTSMHFHGWRKGLKTGMYYLRTRPASSAKKITLAASTAPSSTVNATEQPECISCSS